MLNKLQFLRKKESTEIIEINKQIELEEKVNNQDVRKEETETPEPTGLFHIPSNIQSNKAVMDLILATEQISHQQQMSEQKFTELQNRFQHTSGRLTEQLQEVSRLNRILENRNNQIDQLESKITDKNLKYDQLMEDYKDMQSALSNEIEEIKNIINVEQKKYQSLNDQYEGEIKDWLNKVKKRDEAILELESENENYKEQNEHIRKENKYLLSMASDFTSRMSASFLDYKDKYEGDQKEKS